jgi:hypothetical protein
MRMVSAMRKNEDDDTSGQIGWILHLFWILCWVESKKRCATTLRSLYSLVDRTERGEETREREMSRRRTFPPQKVSREEEKTCWVVSKIHEVVKWTFESAATNSDGEEFGWNNNWWRTKGT